jgi:hypothetical protein
VTVTDVAEAEMVAVPEFSVTYPKSSVMRVSASVVPR